MGFLVHSFNGLAKGWRPTSEGAAISRQAVEREREGLAVILSRLSSGVLVIDAALRLRSANQSAGAILGCDFTATAELPLVSAAGGGTLLDGFVSALRARLAAGEREWREQLSLREAAGPPVLLWACTPLPDEGENTGLAIVFEDITALLNAQRNAAWGEVARRLAHEIKNPLTPIQLSAEQLRRKLLGGLDTEDGRLLERATRTIVQQVDAMKQMVNAFGDYARTPEMQLAQFSLNQLVGEVVELYRLQDPALLISLDLDQELPEIEADRGRVRQILANLLSNGIEVLAGTSGGAITVRTRLLKVAKAARARSAPDLVLLDIWMPDTDGITLLREWSGDARHDCPVVMMSGHGTVETAVEATRLGAFDFIEKPLSLAKLLPTVKRALDARRTRQSGGFSSARTTAPLQGRSRIAQQLRSDLLRLAAYPAPLLLIAEPGSETEALARFVHQSGPRAAGPFVTWNARALQADLAAAALLGGRGQPGLIDQANGGTLYIGDIEELPEGVRGLLAGILETGSFMRSGAAQPVKCDVRFIATALPGIEARAGGATLARDLYAQLSALPLRVPPLRDYAEDVPELLRQCIDPLTAGEKLQFRRCSVAAP